VEEWILEVEEVDINNFKGKKKSLRLCRCEKKKKYFPFLKISLVCNKNKIYTFSVFFFWNYRDPLKRLEKKNKQKLCSLKNTNKKTKMSTSPFLVKEQKERFGFLQLQSYSRQSNTNYLRALPRLQLRFQNNDDEEDKPTLPSDRSVIDLLFVDNNNSNDFKPKFSLYDFGTNELIDVATEIFARARNGQLLSNLSISKDTLRNFIKIVRLNYFDTVPYHNFRHVTCVLHSVHCFFVALANQQYSLPASQFPFSDEEVFATMLAALCHDLQHPGVDNNYLIQSNDILAVRYNYQAVLEQHHCSCCLLLIDSVDDEADIFGHFRRQAGSLEELKKLLAILIGATEVPKHDLVKKNIDKHTAIAKSNNNINNNAAAATSHQIQLGEIERRDLLCGILEASDIGNEVRDNFEDSKRWAARVHAEFFATGDLLKSMGKPVFDSQNSEKLDFAGGQKWFISCMCKPIYESLAQYFSESKIFTTCLETLDRNLQRWQDEFGGSDQNKNKGQQLMDRELERVQFEMRKAEGLTPGNRPR
jgi:hypothetical protein